MHLFPQDSAFQFPAYAIHITIVAVLIARHRLAHHYAILKVRAGQCSRRFLVLGNNAAARMLQRYFEDNKESGCLVAGQQGETLVLSSLRHGPGAPGAQLVEGAIHRVLRSHFVDELVIALPEDRETVERALRAAKTLNISVSIVPDLCGATPDEMPLQRLGPCPVLRIYQARRPRAAFYIKRCIDVILSVLILACCAPVLAILAVVICIDSPGPAIYASKRVGKRGRNFSCYKLRTMIRNADALRDDLRNMNNRDAILFKVKNDPRVTRVGRFLRRYSLDELPQLWNVLKGDMSLIGPRPSLPEEVAQYTFDHLKRLDVNPGITGLWQVCARRDPSFKTYIRFDREYVDKWSPWLDCKILLKTFFVVLTGTGE